METSNIICSYAPLVQVKRTTYFSIDSYINVVSYLTTPFLVVDYDYRKSRIFRVLNISCDSFLH